MRRLAQCSISEARGFREDGSAVASMTRARMPSSCGHSQLCLVASRHRAAVRRARAGERGIAAPRLSSRTWALLCGAGLAGAALPVAAQLTAGSMEGTWNPGAADCSQSTPPPLQVHRYNERRDLHPAGESLRHVRGALHVPAARRDAGAAHRHRRGERSADHALGADRAFTVAGRCIPAARGPYARAPGSSCRGCAVCRAAGRASHRHGP